MGIHEVMEKFIVLYATETGNSEEIAERLCRKLCIINKQCKAINLEDFNFCDILATEAIVVFVCSTTGQGEFPESCRHFWKLLLRKNLPPSCLDFLQFCVIGLGDSSYEKYNVAAKKLNKRLLQLGAIEILPLTLCDDQHELGYDAGFELWLSNFFKLIFGSEYKNLDSLNDILLPPKYHLKFTKEKTASHPLVECRNTTKVKKNERITSSHHFQNVHLVTFEIDESVSYEPGDVIMFMPKNESQNVEDFLKLLNAEVDEEFILEPVNPETPLPKNLPNPCTLRNCVTSYFDIQGIPKRLFFDILWHFSQSELECEKLKEFTTPEGQEELYTYCNLPRRNILEVLQDFPETTPYIPLDYLFDLIPCIRSRSFSIASSLSYHPRELQLIVAQVSYKTRLAKPRKGLCSTWLCNLELNLNPIPFSIKNGSIHLPTTYDAPIIMIGPGTGVAPFRSFIQHRISKKIKENYLFFGCRYEKKDFLCSSEWQTFSEEGFLNLYVAFSRDQEEKIYVQHKMLEQAELIWNLIEQKGAYFYISGNSKNMPTDVKNTLLNILEKFGSMNSVDSKNYLQKLEKQNRYQVETWS